MLFARAMQILGFEFTDKAGSKWQAKSYFKMLARTELMNASRECYDDKMAEEGCDTTAHTDIVNGKIFVTQGHNTVNGCRNVIAHEFGEHLFVRFSKSNDVKDFYTAIQSELNKLPEIILKSKSATSQRKLELQNQFARSILNKTLDDLTANEEQRIVSFFDVAGSITGGKYGFGHTNYLEEIGAGRFGNDAFACMYSAVIHDYKEYQTAYPYLWNFISKHIKK